MLSQEQNELLTRVGPGTPMGDVLRRYWIPALLDWELPAPDCAPVRMRLMGEDLVAFRDTSGRIGVLDENCPAPADVAVACPQRGERPHVACTTGGLVST